MTGKSYIPVLTVAGSDCSGGAGIQADIKTIAAHGCYAMSAITAITVQNTTGVSDIQGINPDIVGGQIEAVWADIPPLAVKTGMLFSRKIVEAVAAALRRHSAPNLVIDPVMVSTSGSQLISDDAIAAVAGLLFPLAAIITPNRSEARRLTGSDNPAEQIRALRTAGYSGAILITGGDSGRTDIKTDLFVPADSTSVTELESPAIDTRNTHGTGCTLSAAIAARLACGATMADAVADAKAYITEALKAGSDVTTGAGHGPVNHMFNPQKAIKR